MQDDAGKPADDEFWTKPRKGTRLFSLSDCLSANIDRVAESNHNPEGIYGLPTGIYDLDLAIGGLEEGDLMVLAGRPSMLKTTMAMKISDHIANQQGLPVLYINLAGKSPSLTIRLISSQSNISTDRLKRGELDAKQWGCFTEALEKQKDSALSILEIQFATVEKILEACREFAKYCGKAGFVVVDYLQLINGAYGARYETRSSELSFTTRQLKSLGQELGCPILAISQLNRAPEGRVDRRPVLSDLRDSGSIEDDADLILFNYLDSYYNSDSMEPGVLESIIAKNRYGVRFVFKQAYDSSTGRLEPLASDV